MTWWARRFVFINGGIIGIRVSYHLSSSPTKNTMRSLFLSRLCLRKKPFALDVRNLGSVRLLSETPLCHIVGARHCGSNSRDGDVGKLVIRNLTASAKTLEKTVPMDLMKETGTIGASQGWVATLKDGVVCLQDDLNPSASDSDPKRITLPPLVTLPHCQTQLVTNVAMSSSSPEDNDCIVAVKFQGPQLSLCRPALKDKSEWVNIRIEDPSLVSSQVTYSKRDKMFSIPGSGGTHTRSWDLEKHILREFDNLPSFEFVQSKWERLLPACRSHHLVESPSGHTFLVKWYTRCYDTGMRHTEHFSVFKIIGNDDVAHATADIGDLCIFLSHKGEPFCLQASLYGLSPNFIYYLGSHDYGKYSLRYNEKVAVGFAKFPAPYFIPPQS